MFNTEEFRTSLGNILSVAATAHGLQGYDNDVIDELQKIAIEVSASDGPDIEASSGGQPQEFRSAEAIAQYAARLAAGERRRYILVRDVLTAIAEKHCTVWPFCKER